MQDTIKTNIFATAKKVEKTSSAKTKDKNIVTMPLLENRVQRFNEIKQELDNLEAEKKMLEGPKEAANLSKQQSELDSLQNAVNYYNLDGYKVHREFEDDRRKTTSKYFLVDDKGTSISGAWPYELLSLFISGYGKAKTEALKIHHEKATKHIHDSIHGKVVTPPTFDGIVKTALHNQYFVNGFTSWHETHFQIVEAISVIRFRGIGTHGIVKTIQEEKGHSGFFEFAKTLTDEFEKKHIGANWDEMDWYDTIDLFIKEKLYDSNKKVTEDIFGTLGEILNPNT